MIPRATVRRRRKFKIEFKAERKLKALTFGNEFILFRISVCFILMRVFVVIKYIFSHCLVIEFVLRHAAVNFIPTGW